MWRQDWRPEQSFDLPRIVQEHVPHSAGNDVPERRWPGQFRWVVPCPLVELRRYPVRVVMIAGLVPPGALATTWFFSWFESFDRAQFYRLLNGPGTIHVQHFPAVEFKSDGAVVGLIDAVVVKLPDRPRDLDTDNSKGETG